MKNGYTGDLYGNPDLEKLAVDCVGKSCAEIKRLWRRAGIDVKRVRRTPWGAIELEVAAVMPDEKKHEQR